MVRVLTVGGGGGGGGGVCGGGGSGGRLGLRVGCERGRREGRSGGGVGQEWLKGKWGCKDISRIVGRGDQKRDETRRR